MKLFDPRDKKIAILGFGKEGISTLRFLKKIWVKDITILDSNAKILNQNLSLFMDLGLEINSNLSDKKLWDSQELKYIFWKDYLENIFSFDLIFKSPGISPYNITVLEKLKNKITTQTEFFFKYYPDRVIGITWTKWKSTTSSLLYNVLKELWYKVKLVWNIWNPVFDEIDITSYFTGYKSGFETYDFVVYELSSYMLEWFSPKLFISILNNIYNCHLDWHNWLQNYQEAKLNILKRSSFNLVWEELKELIEARWFKNITYFGIDNWFSGKDISLRWEHNMKNISGILKAIYICYEILPNKLSLKQRDLKIKNVLKSFKWLPHRQENIGNYKWITFINDSIASTPESTIAALDTFGFDIDTLLIWNQDSWFDFTKLEFSIRKFSIKNIVIFPDTWEKLFDNFWKNIEFDKVYPNPISSKGFIFKTLSMQNAVRFAYEKTKKWKIVLLSTASPSFNSLGVWVMPWKNYLEKGELFRKCVLEYKD